MASPTSITCAQLSHRIGVPDVPHLLDVRDDEDFQADPRPMPGTFLAAPEAEAVTDRLGATPCEMKGVKWSHPGPLCTFDVLLEEFGLGTPALDRLAAIVRGADTAALDLAPESVGLLSISLGLSRQYWDDLAQLDASFAVYDALNRWCRDATEEAHHRPAGKPA